MHTLSIANPVNEPCEDIRANDASWQKFAAAVEKFRTPHDLPMIIDGKKVYSSQKTKNINPSTLQDLGTIQEATAEHANQAINAALKAKASWASLSPSARILKFRDLEAVLLKWKYESCAATAVECGYTALETSVSWAEMIDFVRFNPYFYSQLLAERMGDGIMETNQLQLRPLKGFTCAVTPFNFPIAIGYNLPLVMALTGNTVVWKPSSDAVLTSYLLMLALDEAGFPPGVINMITGEGPTCLPPILKHPELSCLNFTGSFNTARVFGNYLYNTEYKRQNFPRFIAETGGKDFLVADKDIDITDTATSVIHGAFGRSGQKCSATSVLLVHEEIWPKLKEELVKQTKALTMGDPTERNTFMGPVINERAFKRIAAALEKAKTDSACKILCGGNATPKNGYYIDPTFIEVNTDKHPLLAEELFGPVCTVRTYKKIEDAVRIIEQHEYRLTGSVMSRDESFLEKAIPMLSQYAGNFYVNRKTTGAMVNQQPFGGDGASGTNNKAGGKSYLLSFVSQGTITRRHTRFSTPSAADKLNTFTQS